MVVVKTVQRLLPTAIMIASTTALVKNRHHIDFKKILFTEPTDPSLSSKLDGLTPQPYSTLPFSKEELLLHLGASIK